jgi:hypothetical protein
VTTRLPNAAVSSLTAAGMPAAARFAVATLAVTLRNPVLLLERNL